MCGWENLPLPKGGVGSRVNGLLYFKDVEKPVLLLHEAENWLADGMEELLQRIHVFSGSAVQMLAGGVTEPLSR